MANITQFDLQSLLDAPPSYDELFGPSGKCQEAEKTSAKKPEAVNELHRQQEAEAQRLTINQNRYLVRETRANPPEAPHFLAPDLRPWMRDRRDRTQENRDSNSNSTNTRITAVRQNEISEVTKL